MHFNSLCTFSKLEKAKKKNKLTLGNVSEESYKHKRLCIRELIFDDLDYGQDASADLFWSVTMIVSARPQHNHL